MTPLQKLPKNGEDWGKLIVAKGFKKLPKIQNIAQSGHTASYMQTSLIDKCLSLNMSSSVFLPMARFEQWIYYVLTSSIKDKMEKIGQRIPTNTFCFTGLDSTKQKN